MSQNAIDQILEQRRKAEAAASQSAPGESTSTSEEYKEEQFYSLLVAAGLEENYIEFRFRDGLSLSFPYRLIEWFQHEPDDGITIEFGRCMITIRGRGLKPKLYNGLKQHKVAWVKEADSNFEDQVHFETFIEELIVTPAEGFSFGE